MKPGTLLCALCVLSIFCSANSMLDVLPTTDVVDERVTVRATCPMERTHDPNYTGKNNVSGVIDFVQTLGKDIVRIFIKLKGFEKAKPTKHGLHVHANGLIAVSCNNTGGHYTGGRKKRPHGDRYSRRRHKGDLGNIRVNRRGRVRMELEGAFFNLERVIGRGLVIHQNEDDLGLNGDPGSRANGNSGWAIACCVIGRTDSVVVGGEREPPGEPGIPGGGEPGDPGNLPDLDDLL